MAYVTMTTMLLGVVLSAVAGSAYCLGSSDLYSRLSSFPHMDLLLTNPGVALGVGVLLMLAGFFCQPSKTE